MATTSLTLVDRGTISADLNFVLDGYVMGTADEPNPEQAYEDFAVWNLVIDHPDATILWDTGPHHDAADGYWPAPLYQAFTPNDPAGHRLDDDLDAAGYDLADIDAVVMSHLHLDHAGGLHHFAGTDVPIYVHHEEIPFAYFSAKTTEGSVAYLASDFDHELNWNIVHGHRHTLFEGLELHHFPGHTPGLLGALIQLEDEAALIAGDEVYLRSNYEEAWPMATSLLWDNRAWETSLHRVRELERQHDATVLFGHDLSQFTSLTERWG